MRNKKILIVGASQGIGKEIAYKLSKEGADLVLMSRDEKKLQDLIRELKGKNHCYFTVDVNNEEMLREALEKSISFDNRPYNGFVYSVGVEATIPVKLIKKDFLNEVMNTNSLGAISILNFLVKKGNLSKEGASIVFISSVMGHLGETAKTAYSMSKHALIGATKSLSLELAPRKIRVNSVSPGMVLTDMSIKLLESISEENRIKIENMHPLGLGKTSDIANAVHFLLSDNSTWITGTDLYVDGGYSAK